MDEYYRSGFARMAGTAFERPAAGHCRTGT